MRNQNLLVSALGGSLFPYLHECIKSKYNITYVDSDHSLSNLYPELNFVPAPLVKDSSYKQFIIDIIRTREIGVYIPLIDEEIQIAHQIKSEIKDLILILPTYEFCKLCLNKYELMKKLESEKISFIPTYVIDDFLQSPIFPAIIKPIEGRGSRGVQLINSTYELEDYLRETPYQKNELLVQKYIEGVEFTVGVLANNLNNLISISSRKILQKKGITIRAINSQHPAIIESVNKISEIFNASGPYNVQLMLANDVVYIFEINPRFSTTLVMSYASGISEIELFLEFLNKSYDEKIRVPNDGLTLHRNWNNNFYNV